MALNQRFLGTTSTTSVQHKLKLVARQNRRLRELLRVEFASNMSPKDFCLLNVAQITEVINTKKNDKAVNVESLQGKSNMMCNQSNLELT